MRQERSATAPGEIAKRKPDTVAALTGFVRDVSRHIPSGKEDMKTPPGYTDFVVRNQPRLVAYAFAVIGDWHLAEDAAQEALLAIRHHWEKLDRPTHAMWKIVRRKAVRLMQRHRPPHVVHMETHEPEIQRLSAPDGNEDIQNVIDRIHHTRELRRLPLRQREVIVLVYQQGLSLRETAEILGISEAGVRYHRNRAMASLGTKIGSGLRAEPTDEEERDQGGAHGF